MDENEEYTTALDETLGAPLMVRVTAPASLPGGYTFEALLNDDSDRPFLCEVPEGGVEEGESFLAPLPDGFDSPRIKAPTGKWKDGLFNCFSVGLFHPSIWCPFFCSKIALAQIMSRMQLTWLGEHGPYVATKNTFTVVLMLLASYVLYSTSLEIASWNYAAGHAPLGLKILKTIGSILFEVWSIYSICRTRQSVREQYSIPEQHCHGCEDVCCAFFCTCCTLSQMSRHTGEYETYPGVCCTKTGHPPGAPLTV